LNQTNSPGFAVRSLGLAAAYCVSGKLGLLLAIPPGYATAVWPPSGIALAGILLFGYRLWPGVLLGSFAVNVATAFDLAGGWATARSILPALLIACGAALQAVLGAFLVRRQLGAVELVREEDVAKFFLLGGPVSCLVNSSVGVGTLFLMGSIQLDQAAYSWWTWWVGDSIGVAVVAPLVFVWFAEPREVWRRRRASLAVPLAAVLFLIVLLFVWVSGLEEARIRADFEKHAESVTHSVKSSFDQAIGQVQSVANLYAATPEVDRPTFSTFARRTLAAHPAIRALSWNPRVSGEDRSSFEERARRLGYAGFQVQEVDARGNRVAAAPREHYVAVLHIEPLESKSPALGFDVASEPVPGRPSSALAEPGARPPPGACGWYKKRPIPETF
jgi:integral membrane sensor domain MASE1